MVQEDERGIEARLEEPGVLVVEKGLALRVDTRNGFVWIYPGRFYGHNVCSHMSQCRRAGYPGRAGEH